MSPENERGSASQPSPQETATAAPSRITRTDGGTPAYVSIRDQVAAEIITTTRTCDGAYCWCRVGDLVVGYDHRQFMDTLANRVRLLEIAEGVVL